MPKNSNMASFIRENKTLFISLIIFLFLLEIKIFWVASMQAGEKDKLKVYDAHGKLIYVTDGKRLSDFNKYYFEKTFGPFKNYNVKLVTTEAPFPFRAWLVAAIGLPIGIVLLLGFILKATQTLLTGDQRNSAKADAIRWQKGDGIDVFIKRIGHLNIFVMGFFILLALLLYWIVPNALTYLGEISIKALIRLKWILGLLCILIAGLVAWFLYLKYRLAQKRLDAQKEVEKYRLALSCRVPGHPALETPKALEPIARITDSEWNTKNE